MNNLQNFKTNRSFFDQYFSNLPTNQNTKFNSPFREDLNPSCTFYQHSSGVWYIHDWSLDKQYDLIEALQIKYDTDFNGVLEMLGLDRQEKETLENYLNSHSVTKEILEHYQCKVSEKEIKFKYKDGFKMRKLDVPKDQRFYTTKGLDLKNNFFSLGDYKKTINLCAGEIDAIVFHHNTKEFAIGVSEQKSLPIGVLNFIKENKANELNILFDNPKLEKASEEKINSIIQYFKNFENFIEIKVIDWSKYPDCKDISEIASKNLFKDKLEFIEIKTEWEEPVLLFSEEVAVEKLDPSFLPESISSFALDISERMQCPIDFPAIASIIVLGVVIGKKIGICPKRNDSWLVVPNLWGYIVGRPSLMKTPSVKEALNILYSVESSKKEEFEEKLSEFKEQSEVLKIKQTLAKEKIKTDLKKTATADETDRKILSEKIEEPKRRRFIVNDATVEKLGEILADNPNGVLLFRDELNGFFKSLTKEGKEMDRAFYLEAWDGTGKFTYDRIIRGTIEIESICVSIFGTIQPSVLQKIVKESQSFSASDDGLLQRFQLAVYPEISKNWINIDRYPNTEAKNKFKEIVKFSCSY